MAKKTNRIMVALVCTETRIQNYVTSVSKLNPDILKKKVKKYSPAKKAHTLHEFKKKLD